MSTRGERQAVIELAELFHGFARGRARQEVAQQADDIGTVTDVDPIEIELHGGGELHEDAIVFGSNCKPSQLEEGDMVLLVHIKGIYWVVDRGAMGDKAEDLEPAAVPPEEEP